MADTIHTGLDKMQAMMPFMMDLIQDEDIQRAKGTKKIAEILRETVTALTGEHRAALVGMLAVEKDITPEEAAQLPLGELMRFVKGSTMDDLMDFFIFSLRLARKL